MSSISAANPAITGNNNLALNSNAVSEDQNLPTDPASAGITPAQYFASNQTTVGNLGSSATLNVAAGNINPAANQNTINQNLMAQAAPKNPYWEPARPQGNGNDEGGGINSARTNRRMDAVAPNAQSQLNGDLAIGVGSKNKHEVQVNSPNLTPDQHREINAKLSEVYQEKYVNVMRDKAAFNGNDLVQAGLAVGAGVKTGGGWGGVLAGLGSAVSSVSERNYDITSGYRDAVNDILKENGIKPVSNNQIQNMR